MAPKKVSKKGRDEERAASLRAQAAVARRLVLAEVPAEPRALELWAQHAAGMILFERVHAAGIAAIDPELPEEHRRQAERAVDATMYALMMLIDSVSSGIANEERAVGLRFLVEVREGGRVTYSLDLSEGDGMCMAFHGWREGDFGKQPVLALSSAGDPRAPGARNALYGTTMKPTGPTIEAYEGDNGTRYSLHFAPDAIEPLARALAKAGRVANGYAVEAVMIFLSEKGDPAWAADLEFDTENDTFCVRCRRKAPLAFLLRRLEKRLADPAAMRRLVKAAPPALGE